jgi:hypothetical protein
LPYNENLKILDLLQKIPKNNSCVIDNNYLFFDNSQRAIAIGKTDFELEIIFSESYFNESDIMPMYLSVMNNKSKQTVSKKTGTIYECFSKFSQKEYLEEDNQWFCSKCNKNSKAIKKIEIWKAPPLLIIQLKRFKNNIKINNFVEYPIINLDLKRFIKGKDNLGNYKYDLYAIANHTGSMGFGHYKAYALNYLNKKWYKFDDSNVTELQEEALVNGEAYVLFYRRKDITQMTPEQLNELFNREFIDYKDEVKFLENELRGIYTAIVQQVEETIENEIKEAD